MSTAALRIPQVCVDDNTSTGVSTCGESSAPVSPSLSASSGSICSRSSRASIQPTQEFVQSRNATKVRFLIKVKKYTYRSAQFVLPKPTTTDELWEQCILKAQDLMKTSESLQSFITDDTASNEKVAVEVAKVIYAKEIHKANLAFV